MLFVPAPSLAHSQPFPAYLAYDQVIQRGLYDRPLDHAARVDQAYTMLLECKLRMDDLSSPWSP